MVAYSFVSSSMNTLNFWRDLAWEMILHRIGSSSWPSINKGLESFITLLKFDKGTWLKVLFVTFLTCFETPSGPLPNTRTCSLNLILVIWALCFSTLLFYQRKIIPCHRAVHFGHLKVWLLVISCFYFAWSLPRKNIGLLGTWKLPFQSLSLPLRLILRVRQRISFLSLIIFLCPCITSLRNLVSFLACVDAVWGPGDGV